MTIRDPENLELLADKPELLALADALAATQRPPRPLRRRTSTRLAGVAAIAAAILAVVLLLPQGHKGVLDRALAAIGDGPILHLVVDVPTGTSYIDLATGRETVQHYRLELWVDQPLDRFHLVMTYGGRVVGDILYPQDTSSSIGRVDPAFAALWGGYRKALADGTATLAGDGTAYGRHVYWLRFRPVGNEPGSEVAVDAETFKPIVFRTYSGGRPVDQHILLAETTDLAHADFTRHGPSPLLGVGSASTGGGFAIPDNGTPSTTVPHGWLTAGPTAAGDTLAAVLPLTVTPDHQAPIDGIQLVYGDLQYGGPAPDATTVQELPRPDDPQTWAHIPDGAVEIDQGSTTSGSGTAHPQWTGYLVSHTRYITITTVAGKQAVVDIARSLRAAS